ncbi:MAG TPA: serine hydrolase domain-containing protein [Thermoanaerobaculia bacterium]|nr:serine hydrolase domain-containing protein [Thermoanaerobaculia bacterium]
MRRPHAAALLVLLTATCVPATRPAVAMREFLDAYNSGDFSRVAAFFEAHDTSADASKRRERGMDRATWVMGYLHPGIRRFVPARTTASTADAITILGRSASTDAWYRFTMEVDAAPPHAIAFGFEEAEPPSGWRERTMPTAEEYMRRVADAGVFSGAVMIADAGRTIYSGAFGFADAEARRANTIDTPINLGSMNKMFTAIAILQLVERGRIALDDRVGKHLPLLPNRDVAENVTVHHLLTHTSGVGDYFNDAYMARKKELRTVPDLLSLFQTEPLAFRPGEKWQYSNGGYVLLGAIIEAVAGMSYEEYVQQHVYRVAGMAGTRGDCDSCAIGYTFARRGGAIALTRERNDFALPGAGSPAGGGYSTVRDLIAFVRALRAGKLVSPDSLRKMLTPHITNDRGAYGYGFELVQRNGRTIAGHNGHHLGISAQLDFDVDSGVAVAVLSNYDPPAAPVVARRLGEL